MKKRIDRLEENKTMISEKKNHDFRAVKYIGLFLFIILSLYGIMVVILKIRNNRITEQRVKGQQNQILSVLFDEKGVIQVRSYPGMIAWDGEFLWVTEFNEEEKTAFLIQVDPIEGQVIEKLEIDWRPSDIIWDGRYLWVTNYFAGAIQRINPDPLEILNTYPVCSSPKLLTWDGDNLWIGCWDGITLQRFDDKNGKITFENEADRSHSLPIDIFSGGDSVWVLYKGWKFDEEGTNEFLLITQLDSESGTILKEFSLDNLLEPFTASLSWDGSYLWVAGKDKVLKLDAQAGVVIDELIYDGLPEQMTWDGNNLWLLNRRSKSVLQIDPIQVEIQGVYTTHNENSSFALDGTNLWINNGFWIQRHTPSKVNLIGTPADFTWANGQIWIAYGLYDDYGSLQSFDPNTVLFGPTISILDEPTAIVYNGKDFWVTDWEESVLQQISPYGNRTIKLKQIDVGSKPVNAVWDGTYLWIANSWGRSISKVDIKSGEVISEIYVDDFAKGIAWDGNYLWVIVSESKQVKKINPNTNQIESSYSIPMGWEPEQVTWVGDSFWVDGAQRYDPSSGAKINYVDPYCVPDDIVWDSEFLWAACDSQNVVLKLDAHTGKSLALLSIESPLRLLVVDDQIWVASRETIQQINTKSLDYLTSLWKEQ